MNLKQYSFLDSSITAFYNKDNNIYIEIEDVFSPLNTKISGKLTLNNVIEILVDNQKEKQVRMYYPDSEVIHLEEKQDHTLLIVDWTDYEHKKSKIISYKIKSQNITWVESD